jgi:hypothetical protein
MHEICKINEPGGRDLPNGVNRQRVTATNSVMRARIAHRGQPTIGIDHNNASKEAA